ncbi:MAG: tetratricopeptide repeat protein [Actinobacteria bacterium]|nr:tetratricopeptide repeat protein [Actinomycetota bacterium]
MDPPKTQPRGPKKWGKVARHGAGTLSEDEATASGAWRDAMKKARDRDTGPPIRDDDRWVEDRPKARPQKKKGAGRRIAKETLIDPELAAEISRSVQQGRGPRLNQRLKEAANAFEHERFPDAIRILKPLSEIAPNVPGIRELYGLSLYRMGRYRDAAKELRAYADISGAVDQHPVLADCYRALKRWKPIDALWDELREASPSAELVAEGRIVTAGARADRGEIPAAIALLEQTKADPKRPRLHHLRVWYALADLYDKAGDVPRARDLFRRIDHYDPEFFDTRDRLRALR